MKINDQVQVHLRSKSFLNSGLPPPPGLPKAAFSSVNQEFKSHPFVLFSNSAPTQSIVLVLVSGPYLPVLSSSAYTFSLSLNHSRPNSKIKTLFANLKTIISSYCGSPCTQSPFSQSLASATKSHHVQPYNPFPPAPPHLSSAPLPFSPFSSLAHIRSVENTEPLFRQRVAVIELKAAPEDVMMLAYGRLLVP